MILREFIAEIFQRNKPRKARLTKAKQAFPKRTLWEKDQIEKPTESFELGIYPDEHFAMFHHQIGP